MSSKAQDVACRHRQMVMKRHKRYVNHINNSSMTRWAIAMSVLLAVALPSGIVAAMLI
jgi:hypothetical protein